VADGLSTIPDIATKDKTETPIYNVPTIACRDLPFTERNTIAAIGALMQRYATRKYAMMKNFYIKKRLCRTAFQSTGSFFQLACFIGNSTLELSSFNLAFVFNLYTLARHAHKYRGDL
jgi:hypothetical protein